jgi:hypothetical protein
METVEHTSIFLNWSFWAVIVAALALLLSQLPPIKILVRPIRLRVEPYDRLGVTRWLGNPNVNLHLVLTNTGGRKVSILSVNLILRLEDGSSFSLPAQSFSAPGAPKGGSFLFTRFALKPDESWSNFVSCFANFDTADERQSKELVKNLRRDINQRLKIRLQTAPGNKELMEADEKFVQPIRGFYEKHNKWRAGEYTVQLHIKCEPERASTIRRFRFTLFESDVQDLAESVSKYKYGAGVYYVDADPTPAVNPRIRDIA